MDALLGAVPALLALALIIAGIRPARASLLALAAGIVVLLVSFPTPVARLASAEKTAVLTALEVLLIMLGGVLLYEALVRARTFDVLADWLTNLSRDRGTLALVMVLGVTPFAESVTGFGVGILFAIPLLQRVGFDALRSIVIGLLGLVIVPWGALAPGTLVAARLTGVSFADLGTHSAVMSLPVFLIAGAAALIVSTGVKRALVRVPQLLLAVAVLGGTVFAVNASIGPPLAGVLGGGATVITFALWMRATEGRSPAPGRRLLQALVPFGLLVALLLVFRVCAALMGGTDASNGGAPRTAAYVLESPALALLVTVIILIRSQHLARPERNDLLRRAAARWRPVAVPTAAFVLLGGLMTASGMAAAIAQAAVDHLGGGYLFLAPWVGGLSGYVTGSNTAANAMLATAQSQAATQLAYPVIWLVAIQNVSGSLLTMISAPRIALALTLVDVRVDAARVTRPLALVLAIALAALGGLAYLWR